MKVVVVEDDEDLCIELVEYLRRRYREVVACGTVSAARHVLREMVAKPEPLAGIVCEMTLPDGNGVDLHSEFAAELGTGRWLLMCNFTDGFLLYEQVPNVPRPLFLDKPFSLDDLDELLVDTWPVINPLGYCSRE